jgi:uncharacterized membrane protein
VPVAFRLVTLHPALAHLAIGATAVALVAYVLAAWARQPRWSFAGDVALLVAAPSVLTTAMFGLVSDRLVQWPGGLETWRIIHMVAGLTAAASIACVAVVRWRRRVKQSGSLQAIALAVIAGIIGATGWVGGEVLVFHSGMAVSAAGDGALAPPLRHAHHKKDFLGAMHRVRAAWGGINAELAWILVHEPRDAGFSRIAGYADELAAGARSMGDDPEVADEARTLKVDAIKLGEAARAKDLQALPPAIGKLSSDCAHCHHDARW